MNRQDLPAPKADACILIWLPGGVSQTETWDPKPFTPYEPGMKMSSFRSTCRSIPTSVDGIFFGEGLEDVASIMHLGAVVRSLSEPTDVTPVHWDCIYEAHTGYKFPSGFKAPSLGAILSRTLGPRHPNVPAYVDIGRNLESSNSEDKFLSATMGPGFYPQEFGPFEVGDPFSGAKLLERLSSMTMPEMERRVAYRPTLAESGPLRYSEDSELRRYVDMVNKALAIMDSPIRDAFNFSNAASVSELSAYGYTAPKPEDKRVEGFKAGCLLARRLIETGVRFVEVEYPYYGFQWLDTHFSGGKMYPLLKRGIDAAIARLVRDLDERGLLERTLVVVMSEFGRTIVAGTDSLDLQGRFSRPDELSPDDARALAEASTFRSEKEYGYHAHFRTWSALFFGGGVHQGVVHGKTAEEHPMVAIENPVSISDVHATIFHLLGLKPDVYFMDNTRPVYITDNGEGQAIHALIA